MTSKKSALEGGSRVSTIEHTLAEALSCLHDVEIALAKLIRERDELIDERDALAQEVERLQGDGVHTCGPHCRRIACVLRRERDDLLDVLGTLTEHFEYYMGDNECRPLENARAALARAQGVQP